MRKFGLKLVVGESECVLISHAETREEGVAILKGNATDLIHYLETFIETEDGTSIKARELNEEERSGRCVL